MMCQARSFAKSRRGFEPNKSLCVGAGVVTDEACKPLGAIPRVVSNTIPTRQIGMMMSKTVSRQQKEYLDTVAKIDIELSRVKQWANENDFHVGTSMWMVVTRYRRELKVLRAQLYDNC